ncbi:YbaK/EbsC family protein [Lutispora saccharofermentans]|uniref:YbaK/EbsC family protein n=1 Tax=Lutispora saccharofermentans TaxID=3024236 RepID=A0ABT1NLU5_9FIRM|nr:YbaK/EbsC family protein [Lutispora saccharofermentans]MCQ1531574.1 YbaK/EbsC family protein [Lutispora saccharofermentans]
MSIESVKKQFKDEGLPLEVIEMDTSTATVELAAAALGVEPARIAKTMAFRLKDRDILLLAKGDVKVDNRKFKDNFAEKPRFISLDDLEEATGHPAGGVCPFGLIKLLDIYLDESLKVFDYVFPAGGGANTAVKISVDYLAEVTKGIWVDVCK